MAATKHVSLDSYYEPVTAPTDVITQKQAAAKKAAVDAAAAASEAASAAANAGTAAHKAARIAAEKQGLAARSKKLRLAHPVQHLVQHRSTPTTVTSQLQPR